MKIISYVLYSSSGLNSKTEQSYANKQSSYNKKNISGSAVVY